MGVATHALCTTNTCGFAAFHVNSTRVISGRRQATAWAVCETGLMGTLRDEGARLGGAELLGLNPNTLRSRMRKLGIPFRKDRRAR